MVGRVDSKAVWKHLLILPLLLSVFGSGVLAQQAPLRLYWVDVEGGGATLIVTPSGESILVDAGENLERDVSRVLHVATKIAGVKQIDHFVATHWHADHYGGAITLSTRMPMKKYYGSDPFPDRVPEDPQFAKLMPAYKAVTKGNSIVLRPGDSLPLRQTSSGPPLELKVFAVNRRVIGRSKLPANPVCSQKSENPADPTENSKSIVLLLTYGKFTFLDGGDLTRAMEEQLVCPSNVIGEIDLFQIDHHGLDLSNNPLLIRSIKPRVVVVNNGPQKGAEPNTMKTLFATSSIETVWQLHRNLQPGTQLNTASEFIANLDVDGKADFIQASAMPDGKFRVQIGSSGKSRDYKAR
jgi:competence protein ComEC